MSFPWEGHERGGRRVDPSEHGPGGDRQLRAAQHAAAHLQPRVAPRAVGRSNFERAASGASVGFIGEVTFFGRGKGSDMVFLMVVMVMVR